MEDEEAGIPKLSKRFSDKGEGGEVDYKTKSGTAWSHNFLNQKPWHPLSYPNQRRKWISEQTHAQRKRRNEEVSREYAQEQDFLRQTSLLTQKEKEKVDLMQAVSFMYVRPPGYNAESAKAAEIIDEKGKLGNADPAGAASSSMPQESVQLKEEKKKARPKDVFGRSLPTEEEFSVLKNAPKFETGVAGRAKPFAIELRNVKCVRCGTYGHQSGDRDCPMKDVIMPNEESRLKRDDPLTAIIAHMDSSEPLKWELKQKPGISPPRGGFQQDDPNQQIVAEEDIFDEYGGFLTGGSIPELLTNFSSKKHKKKTKSKTKHKKRRSSSSSSGDGSSDSDTGKRSAKREKNQKPRKTNSKIRKKKERSPPTDSGEDSDSDSDDYRKPRKDDMHKRERSTKSASHLNLSDGSRDERYHTGSRRHKRSSSEDGRSDSDTGKRSAKRENIQKPRKTNSKIRKKKERSPPADSSEESYGDSDEYRKPRKDVLHKRERSIKSASHLNLSGGSRDERYHTGSRRHKRSSNEDGRSDSDTGKRSAKRENIQKLRETYSKIQKKIERSPPTDSGEDSDSDSDDYRKPRKHVMHKRERSTKSASHLNLSDGSRDDTGNRRHKRSHHADNMESDKNRHHSEESRKPRNDEDSDSERKFISKSKRHKDARLISPENSESDRYRQKHGYKNSSHNTSERTLSGKLESDKYRRRGH